MKITLSERAIAARLNRFLDKRGETLRKCRTSSRCYRELGDYYLVDMNAGMIRSQHVNLENLARESGVLKTWEEIA